MFWGARRSQQPLEQSRLFCSKVHTIFHHDPFVTIRTIESIKLVFMGHNDSYMHADPKELADGALPKLQTMLATLSHRHVIFTENITVDALQEHHDDWWNNHVTAVIAYRGIRFFKTKKHHRIVCTRSFFMIFAACTTNESRLRAAQEFVPGTSEIVDS